MTPAEKAKEAFDLYAAMSGKELPPSSISALQVRLYRWQTANFGGQDIHRPLLGAVEEVGELSHALLKHEQGIRGLKSRAAFLEAAGDAVADTVIYLMQVCTLLRLGFGVLLKETAENVMERDWNLDSEKGGE